jgi:hypothetical protein
MAGWWGVSRLDVLGRDPHERVSMYELQTAVRIS